MSTTEKRRRLPVAERRELVMAAAGRLFGERGYDGTRLDAIAAAAGVTKPVLYRHFDSKRDLYLALLARHRDDLPTFTASLPAEGSLAERLHAVVDAWLGYVETHAYAWRMLFRDTGGDREVREFRRQVHAQAREVLAGVIRSLGDPTIPAREVEPLAELMSMGMASLVLWWMEERGASRDALVDAIVRVWTGLLESRGT
jgi:AcrR family transcriptional regulator